jgi:hypothetical protein
MGSSVIGAKENKPKAIRKKNRNLFIMTEMFL